MLTASLFGLITLSACTRVDLPGALSEPKLLLISVKAIRPTSGSNTDTVYLKLSNNKRYPLGQIKTQTMQAGTIWRPNFFTSASERGSIVLFEADSVTSDDEIGRITIKGSEKPGSYKKRMTGDGSIYEVTYEVRH